MSHVKLNASAQKQKRAGRDLQYSGTKSKVGGNLKVQKRTNSISKSPNKSFYPEQALIDEIASKNGITIKPYDVTMSANRDVTPAKLANDPQYVELKSILEENIQLTH